MQEILINNAIKAFTSRILSDSSTLLGSIGSELAQVYKAEIDKYFVKQKNACARVKTLLRGNTPAYLYDIYFPINVLKGSQEVSTEKVTDLFSETNFVTIIGGAGSGKSVLIKHLFLSSIAEQYGIPILIELRYLNDYPRSIEDYITETIFENRLSQNTIILDRLLKKGRFVFFLDGFDEIAGAKHELTIKQIGEFINKYECNKFILTSRPYTNVEFLPLFHNYHMQPLKNDEIAQFVALQLGDETELAGKIVRSAQAHSKGFLSSFLTNPLLLSLYILTFQSNPDVPAKKYIFYRRVVQALFSEHDSKSKVGFVREKASKLSQESFEDILKKFSFLTFFDKKYSFDLDYLLATFAKIKQNSDFKDLDSHLFINDLKLALALWVEDGNRLSFSHRSLQEYFAASFIKDLQESQKKTIFEKLLNLLPSLNEIDNFLSLCKEMDEVQYTKHFLLPSIDIAVSRFTDHQGVDLVAKLVREAYQSIGWAESDFPLHHVKPNPMRKIEEVYGYLTPLYNFLQEQMDTIAGTNVVQVDGWVSYYEYIYGPTEERVSYLNLNPVPEEIISHLVNEGILTLVEGIVEALKDLKTVKAALVRESEKANEKLIDLI
jgi:hypothetical protein